MQYVPTKKADIETLEPSEYTQTELETDQIVDKQHSFLNDELSSKNSLRLRTI